MTSATQAVRSAAGPVGSPLTIGAMLSALGALSVLVTSGFYLVSPRAAAGPLQPLDLHAAMAGAAAGSTTLHIAGTIGIFGDLIWAVAALLVAQSLAARGRGIDAAGWLALFLSIVIFTFVDGMTGYVFPPLAKAPDASAFLGFKHLWDMLFQLGTIAYGIGVAVALGADRMSSMPMIGRVLAYAAIVVAILGALGAAAGMGGYTAAPTDRIAGASIGLGSALLVAISLQIARVARRMG